jgi:hypothetical protein
MKRILVNYSGHPLSREASRALAPDFDELIQPEPFHFDFLGDANEQLGAIATKTLASLDPESVLTIIPPGQSTLAILLVSFIHGLIGHFPRLCYLELNESGMYMPRTEYQINTQEVRLAGRFFRMKKFSQL